MGRRARLKPARLAGKLFQIRNSLGLSQSQLLRRLGFDEVIDYRRISEFELGTTEPPLPVLLAYARLAGIHVEELVDDCLEVSLDRIIPESSPTARRPATPTQIRGKRKKRPKR